MKSFVNQSEIIKQPAKQYSGSAFSFLMAQPSPALKEYIDFYYQAEAGVQENDSSHLKLYSVLLPLDAVEMVFCYNDTTARFNSGEKSSSSPFHIVGPHNLQSQCLVDDISKINKSFFIRFKHGGFSKLFGIRQNEIKNNIFTVSDILNSQGRSLENQVNNSASLEERIKAVENFLMHNLQSTSNIRGNNFACVKSDNTHLTVQLINKNKGNVKVRDIAKYLNIPERTLNWNFSNYMGLSPKEFISLYRFRNFMSILSRKADIKWIELAQHCGYYDQSHLINEFKSVTGITPFSYLKNQGKAFIKCVNKLTFIESSANGSLNELAGDLIKVEKIAAL